MGEEQRRFERVPESFEVRCRHYGAFSETWRSVVTLDLSASGLSFQSLEAYELAEMLEVEIRLPSFRTPLVLHGEVVRCKPMPSGVWESAIHFQDVKPDEQVQIDELVQFLRRPPSPSS
jgi:hypothetical protein